MTDAAERAARGSTLDTQEPVADRADDPGRCGRTPRAHGARRPARAAGAHRRHRGLAALGRGGDRTRGRGGRLRPEGLGLAGRCAACVASCAKAAASWPSGCARSRAIRRSPSTSRTTSSPSAAAGPCSRSRLRRAAACRASCTTRPARGRRSSSSRSRRSRTRTGCARPRSPSATRWRGSSAISPRSSAGQAEQLIVLVEATAELDLVIARGTLSRGWRGALVTPSHDVVLRGARHPLLDRASAVPIDLELGSLRRARDQRAEHGRQDRGAEDARARRRALPVRPAATGGRGGAARLRRDPRRHRRRAVDRDEPLDLLRPPAEPRRDPRAGDGRVARAPRRDRRRHRPRRGCSARRGAARPPRDAGAAHRDDEPLRGAEGMGERRRRRRQRRHRDRSGDERAALHGDARPARDLPRAADGRAARAAGADRRGRARPHRAGAAAGRRARRRGRGSGARGAASFASAPPPSGGRRKRRAPKAQRAGRGAPGRDRAGAIVGGGRAAARPDAGRGGARGRAGRARGAARRDQGGAEARAGARPCRDAGRAEEGGRARPQARRGVGSSGSRVPLARPTRRAAGADRAARGGRPGRGARSRRQGDDRRDRRRRGDRARAGRPPHSRPARPASSRSRRDTGRSSRPSPPSRSGR